MQFQRSSGVLLHVSSLPSYGGIGDLGPAAHEFVAFLAAAKQHVWQVLPLCPTGYGNSPYAGSSAFAGNPYLISLEFLADWGWIDRERIAGLAGTAAMSTSRRLRTRKLPLLYEAAGNFLDRGPHEPQLAEQWEQFQQFCQAQAAWLTDYALYAELRRQFNTGAWTQWPEPIRRREPDALAKVTAENGRALGQEQVLQFAFSLQWNHLREAAARSAIRILGDMAIFVNMDSSDVWVHPELFELDEQLAADSRRRRSARLLLFHRPALGQSAVSMGCDRRAQGFGWWIDRIRRACELYDIVRLDHFRGFEAYWAIPADEETAINGEWIKAPGLELFRALEAALGPLPLVAEDLGLITAEVDALRLELGLPGMKVLQFGFSDKGAHIHLPQRFTPERSPTRARTTMTLRRAGGAR